MKKKLLLTVFGVFCIFVGVALAVTWMSETELTTTPDPDDEVGVHNADDTTDSAQGSFNRIKFRYMNSYNVGSDFLDDHDYGGFVYLGGDCGETLVQFDCVRIVNDSDIWHKADANATGEIPPKGIAVAACTDTNAATILKEGVIRDDTWNWTAGATIYLGENSQPTSTAPSDTGDYICEIGQAISADEIDFDFGNVQCLTVQ